MLVSHFVTFTSLSSSNRSLDYGKYGDYKDYPVPTGGYGTYNAYKRDAVAA